MKKLRAICSNIACKNLRVGDRVELVNNNSLDLGGNSAEMNKIVGSKFTIKDIRKSLFCHSYIILEGIENVGYWANCFRKISK